MITNPAKTIYVVLFDGLGKKSENGRIGGSATMYDGGSQANAIPVFTGDKDRRYSNKTLSNVINHELGHTGGLDHVWEKGENNPDDVQMDYSKKKQGSNITGNLMNSEENPNVDDRPSQNGDPLIEKRRIVTDGQRDKVIKTVEHEQK